MDNKAYFNSKAELWDSIVMHDMDKVKRIVDLIGIKEGDEILDVGTGTGVVIPVLQSYLKGNGKITAIDISDKMIEAAQRKVNDSNVEFIVGDVMVNAFKERHFDCIICYSMFPHFEDKKAAIVTLAKYLKKTGKLVICHSQSREAINTLHRDISGPVQNDRLPSMDVLKEFLKDAALAVNTEIDDEDMFVLIGAYI